MKKSLMRKNYARLLGIIGQSKEAVSGNEIVDMMKQFEPSSDWRYIYEMLDELSPSRIFKFGTRMFCVNDLFSEDFDTRKKSSVNLIKKLKKSHEQYAKIKGDDLHMCHFFDNNNNKSYVERNEHGEIRKVIIEDYDKNLIEVEGVTPSKEIISNLQPIITIAYCASDYRNIQVALSPKLMIPLALKKKGGKLYAHQPVLSDDDPIQFLNPISKVSKNLRDKNTSQSINSLDLQNSMTSSKKYRLNLRGLMLFILSEDNFVEINDVLKNLIETDTDVELKKDSSGLSYTVKENFPFLSRYFIEFQRVVRKDFAFIALKRAGKIVQNKLESISMKELKYIVTREYYAQIEKFYWSKDCLLFGHLELNLYGYNGNYRDIWMYKLSILYFIRKSVEEDLSLINKMIIGNELAADTNLNDWRSGSSR
ncbi:MAG: hypothetical protein M3Y53_01505 [Thermoproteota archaeon]|nr:hypothetical protein [Thermoproteota archaeon]